MLEKTQYTYLHGLLGTNIDWEVELEKTLEGKGDVFAPPIDYFQSPHLVRTYIKNAVMNALEESNGQRHILIANSVGCHFGMDLLDNFESAFFISPTYDFDRGTVSRSRSSIRSEVRKLFFDKSILEKRAEILDQETLYIASRLQQRTSIKALMDLKRELMGSDYALAYKANANKIHVILGVNDPLIPVKRYLDRKNELGVSIDIIPNCSHVAPVEKPDELRKILAKYGS
ncbi:MAG TPA: alpha/beta hydrolase [Ghiorsea sp.]|nr:alpha/beta hydrolase [Ghiorsea sp.]